MKQRLTYLLDQKGEALSKIQSRFQAKIHWTTIHGSARAKGELFDSQVGHISSARRTDSYHPSKELLLQVCDDLEKQTRPQPDRSSGYLPALDSLRQTIRALPEKTGLTLESDRKYCSRATIVVKKTKSGFIYTAKLFEPDGSVFIQIKDKSREQDCVTVAGEACASLYETLKKDLETRGLTFYEDGAIGSLFSQVLVLSRTAAS